MLSLSVAVSGDGLGAKLRIDGYAPDEWKSRWSAPDGTRLRAFLEAQGIAPRCIRDDILAWITGTLEGSGAASLKMDLEAVQGVDVAQGRAPRHEEPLGLVFHASYLREPAAIAAIRGKLVASGTQGAREAIDPANWVSSGSTVLSYQGVSAGEPGFDVFGAPLTGLSVLDRLPSFGKSLFLRERRLTAACDGALIIEEGRLKVLGPDSLPACEVVVSGDGMTADLVLGGNYMNDWTVTPEMARSALSGEGIRCMLPDAELLAAIAKFNRDLLPVTLTVARGRSPVPGRAGRVELLVDPEPQMPEPGPGGSIDFKGFSFFRTVEAGTRLARLVPPEPGRPGVDVRGKEIVPPDPGRFDAEPGKNTALTGGDPVYVAATASGRLAMRGGMPEVVEVLDVSGNVSLKTGNIEFPGAVKVSGDVHNRMAIQAVGDVEVMGAVEDSVIRSDGAIVIRGGVNGSGNGLIKSRLSSVTIGYLHNQRIESHSDIVVYNEIINSQLFARRNIQMRYGKYAVLGGYLLAGESMDLFNVGSEAGSKTILEVGKDFEVEAEIGAKSAKLFQYSRDMDFLGGMEERLAGIIRLKHAGADEETLLRKRTSGALEILEQWSEALRRELKGLANRLYTRDACEIIIRGTAHPGTILKFREQILVLSEPVTDRRWIFREKTGPS